MGEKLQFNKNCNFQYQIITYLTVKIEQNAAPVMYWLPSIVLQLKCLKLRQESYSPWLWVMIQSCSSFKPVNYFSSGLSENGLLQKYYPRLVLSRFFLLVVWPQF